PTTSSSSPTERYHERRAGRSNGCSPNNGFRKADLPRKEQTMTAAQHVRATTGMARPRVLIIGLDCAAPELLFDAWRQDLPTINRLMSQGAYGKLESTIPAMTVPALFWW